MATPPFKQNRVTYSSPRLSSHGGMKVLTSYIMMLQVLQLRLGGRRLQQVFFGYADHVEESPYDV
ncbi:hypothetical protein LIA77_02475 [Sarocladium implicatum]|nr:hypothetical protein LIA77_02475 [Sarocladium implicatum]